MVDNQSLPMEVNSSLSLVSHTIHSEEAPRVTGEGACTYSGDPILVLGHLEVKVQYQDQNARLTLTVVEGEGPSLLGRDWLQHIHLDCNQVHSVSTSSLKRILNQKEALFQPELGTLKRCKAIIHVDVTATHKFCRSTPSSIRHVQKD